MQTKKIKFRREARTIKEAAAGTAASLLNCSVRCLELLDQSGIQEPSQVIVAAAWIAGRVAKLEPNRLRRVLTKYVVHTHGDGGVVQDILPARHTVNSRRRHFLFLALFAGDDFLTAFRVPRHRRRFHWRGEDQAVGELRVCEPGRVDPVLLPNSIKLLGLDLFPESIHEVHGDVEINVVPGPVKVRQSLPFVPGVASGHVPEKAACKPIGVGAPGHLPCPFSGEFEYALIQITHPGQPRKYAKARLYLVLKAKVNAARV